MLPWVFIVIDYRRHPNVVRTLMTHSAVPYLLLFCSYHTLMSSVIYHCTFTRHHGIYLWNRPYPGDHVFFCTSCWFLLISVQFKLNLEKGSFCFKIFASIAILERWSPTVFWRTIISRWAYTPAMISTLHIHVGHLFQAIKCFFQYPVGLLWFM